MILVTVGADAQHGMTVGERAPQRTPLAGGPPAGLVDVQCPGGTDAPQQVGVGLDQRGGDTLEDRVDRAA